jgi:hypothetical protein
MNSDAGTASRGAPERDIWRLPKVMEVRFRRKRFDPPRRVTSLGVDRMATEAVEVEIVTSEPFMTRALGPVLWIGETALTTAEGVKKNVYRFFSFEPEVLKTGARVTLSWNSPGAPRQETDFHYELR